MLDPDPGYAKFSPTGSHRKKVRRFEYGTMRRQEGDTLPLFLSSSWLGPLVSPSARWRSCRVASVNLLLAAPIARPPLSLTKIFWCWLTIGSGTNGQMRGLRGNMGSRAKKPRRDSPLLLVVDGTLQLRRPIRTLASLVARACTRITSFSWWSVHKQSTVPCNTLRLSRRLTCRVVWLSFFCES